MIVTLKHQPGFEFLQKDGSVLKKRYKAVYFQNVVDSYKKFSKQEKGYNVRYIAIPGGGITKAVYFPIVLTEVIYFRLTKLVQASISFRFHSQSKNPIPKSIADFKFILLTFYTSKKLKDY